MLRIAMSVSLLHPRGETEQSGPPRLGGNHLGAHAGAPDRLARRDHVVAQLAAERAVDRLHRRLVLGGERGRAEGVRVRDRVELAAVAPDRLPARPRVGERRGAVRCVRPQDRAAAPDHEADLDAPLALRGHARLVMLSWSVSIASRMTEGIASRVSARYSLPCPRQTPGSITCSVAASTIDITRVPSTS